MFKPYYLLSLLLAVFQTGCGLLFVPYNKEVPSSNCQMIYVYDASNKNLIPDAEARLRTSGKSVNWFPPEMTWRSCNIVSGKTSQDTGKVLTHSRRLQDGALYLSSRNERCWAQVTFPVGFPLGFALFRESLYSIVIDAEGYQTAVISVCPQRGKTSYVDKTGRTGNKVIMSEEHIEIFLERSGDDAAFRNISLSRKEDPLTASDIHGTGKVKKP